MGKNGEYWVVRIDGSEKTIVLVNFETSPMRAVVYPCGDEQGWPIENVTKWIRKIRL